MGKLKKLFEEFPPVSQEQWEEKIQQDLKGAPYKKLITKTPEGIDIRPYYHSNDMKGLEYLDSLPGRFPYNRSARIQLNEWEIRQDILVDDINKANRKALKALNRGATALGFIIPETMILTFQDIDKLLNGIFFECIHINFITHTQAHTVVHYLKSAIDKKDIPGDKILGSVSADPLGYLGSRGYLPEPVSAEFKKLSDLVRSSSEKLPFFKTIAINTFDIHNAGASCVQELGMAMAQVSEYLERLTDKGLEVDEIAPYFQLNFATGSNYFMEIAKNRAARLLFANLVKAWGAEKERSMRVFIHSTTSEWNMTLYDPYVNMLRGTTESMAAVLGGANSLTVLPFDKTFRETTPFSERIARNTQVILKEEAHLNKVVDPAGGSYYIENLTDSLAEEAWKLFLDIEDRGGYYNALKKGYVQKLVKETSRQRDMNIATRKEVLLGTNQYPNSTEKVHEDFIPEIASPEKEKPAKPEVEKFEKYRGAMAFEQLRLKVERSEKEPVVFLLNYGNLNWRKARAGFAFGFFACAGYKIIENLGFDTVEAGMKAAEKAKADIIVLCSSDDEYLEMAKTATTKNKNNAQLVVAGNPADSIDELKSLGIKKFIHMKSNILQELKDFNKHLGIK